MRGIDAEEQKVKRSLKIAAKRKDTASCKILAKEIVRSRKARDRIYTSKAQLNSLVMHMQQQLGMYSGKCVGWNLGDGIRFLTFRHHPNISQSFFSTATMKISHTLQKSTSIMSLVNNLVKLPEISATMQEMSAEMMKAGIIEEMMEDTIEMGDEEGIEEEAEDEVNKVLFELTDGMCGTRWRMDVGAFIDFGDPLQGCLGRHRELLGRRWR